MIKTPEEMAVEFSKFDPATDIGTDLGSYRQGLFEGFLAGYKAAQPQWISVKDRLPEDGRTVIYRISVVTPNGNRWKLDYGEWDANEQTFFGEFFDHRELGWDVTHWMELPEAPKEEK